jgi:hypothetical protein
MLGLLQIPRGVTYKFLAEFSTGRRTFSSKNVNNFFLEKIQGLRVLMGV